MKTLFNRKIVTRLIYIFVSSVFITSIFHYAALVEDVSSDQAPVIITGESRRDADIVLNEIPYQSDSNKVDTDALHASTKEVVSTIEEKLREEEERTRQDFLESATASSLYVETTGVSYSASGDGLDWLYATVEAETHGADSESKKRIVGVILNRVNDGRFPSTIYGVVTQANQFAHRWDIEQSTINAVDEALAEGYYTDGALWFCTCSSGCWASENATRIFTDNVGHHFWR